jgi:hypothetical protein
MVKATKRLYLGVRPYGRQRETFPTASICFDQQQPLCQTEQGDGYVILILCRNDFGRRTLTSFAGMQRNLS